MQTLHYSSPVNTVNRMISSILLAGLVTFSLFAMMYLLIKPPLAERPSPKILPVVELFITPEDPPV
uniref:hypothetical protein n=1 Tax=Arsukibacterium sp. TaxID=1977258 RepID=UPI0035636888